MFVPRRSISSYIATPQSHSYCLQQIRNFDHENFIANLLQPAKEKRSAHAALRAFNLELVNIRANVSNEDLGRLRIQFFRDAFQSMLTLKQNSHQYESSHSQTIQATGTDDVYGSKFEEIVSTPEMSSPTPGSPVLEALAQVISTYPNVQFNLLNDLIDARENDLGYPSIRTVAELENFANATQGTLINIHSQLLTESSNVDYEQLTKISKHCGTAVGLAVILRGSPAHAASRLSYMPQQLTSHYNVSANDLLHGTGKAVHVFEEIATRAEQHIDHAKLLLPNIQKCIHPAFWPIIMTQIYLERLKKAKYNPFDQNLQRGLRTTYSLQLQFRLLKTRVIGF